MASDKINKIKLEKSNILKLVRTPGYIARRKKESKRKKKEQESKCNLADYFRNKRTYKEEVEKKAREEKAYRDSLKKIPDQKAVNDPWGGVREAESSSTNKAKPRPR